MRGSPPTTPPGLPLPLPLTLPLTLTLTLTLPLTLTLTLKLTLTLTLPLPLTLTRLLNTFLFQLAGLIIGARLVWPMANPDAVPSLGRSGSTQLRSLAEAGALGVTGEDVSLAVGTWVLG